MKIFCVFKFVVAHHQSHRIFLNYSTYRCVYVQAVNKHLCRYKNRNNYLDTVDAYKFKYIATVVRVNINNTYTGKVDQ